MEEKFDEEFKKKVKGINPEIPDVVKLRINDTLASLPVKRNWRKLGYLSAVAAAFIVCFIGVRYMYPMKSAKNTAQESPQNFTAAAGPEADKQKDQRMGISAIEGNADSNERNEAAAENAGNSPTTAIKAPDPSQLPKVGAAKEGAGAAVDTAKVEASLTSIDGKTAADQGIQLVLKTAIYDGKEIRIEFDKTSEGNTTSTASGVQAKDATSDIKLGSTVKYAGVNVAAQYDIRIVVNDIPLKCSVNVIETPNGENQYSGTMIIIPDSGLPENFDMKLSIDKIGEISGQWLLKTSVLKK